jgi:hypothetical protein
MGKGCNLKSRSKKDKNLYLTWNLSYKSLLQDAKFKP